MFDYIDNAYARAWVSSRFNSRRGVFIPLAFIDINEGNLHDAMLFSQIMYWHEPSTESGKPRLTIKKDGNYWLAKNHGDWFDECRINKSTVRKCLERLKERKLIEYALHGFDGDKTPFVRVNWSTFETLMKNWEKEQADKSGHTPVLREQGGMPQQDTGVSQRVKPNTETTAKTTKTKTTTKKETPNGVAPSEHVAASAILDAWFKHSLIVMDDPSKIYKIAAYKNKALALHNAGIAPDDVIAFIADLRTDKYHKGRGITLDHVARDILAWKLQHAPTPEPEPAPVENPARPDYPYSNLSAEQHAELDALFADVESKL